MFWSTTWSGRVEKHLFLAEMKRWLLERPGVRGAMMSGSGSTMFAVMEGGDAAAP